MYPSFLMIRHAQSEYNALSEDIERNNKSGMHFKQTP